MPPMVFLAEVLADNPAYQPMVIFGSEVPFPFQPAASKIPVPGISEDISAAMPLLDQWGIPSRLASLQGLITAIRVMSRIWPAYGSTL